MLCISTKKSQLNHFSCKSPTRSDPADLLVPASLIGARFRPERETIGARREPRSINQSRRRLQVPREISLSIPRAFSRHGAARSWHARRPRGTRARYHGAPSLSSRLPGDDTLSRLNSFGSCLFTPVMSRYGADNVKQPILYRSDEATFFSHRFLAIVTLEDRRRRITVATEWQRPSLFLSPLFSLSFFSLVERRRLDSALVHLLVFFLTHLLSSYLAAVPITWGHVSADLLLDGDALGIRKAFLRNWRG